MLVSDTIADFFSCDIDTHRQKLTHTKHSSNQPDTDTQHIRFSDTQTHKQTKLNTYVHLT